MLVCVVRWKFDCISWLVNIIVVCRLYLWNVVLIRCEIFFFFSGLFSIENGRLCGRIFDRIVWLMVVVYSVIFGMNFGVFFDVFLLWIILVICMLMCEVSLIFLFLYVWMIFDMFVNDRFLFLLLIVLWVV